MKERRKIQDRREKEPKQGLPGYYARRIPDRRNNNTSKVDTNRQNDIITAGIRVAVFIACAQDLLKVTQKRELEGLQVLLVPYDDHHPCGGREILKYRTHQ